MIDDEFFQMVSCARKLSWELHLPTPVRLVSDQEAGRVEGLSQYAVAWYDPASDEISVNIDKVWQLCEKEPLPVVDVLGESIFHEAVGHYGLRLLLGDKFEATMEHVYDHAVPGLREALRAKRQQLEQTKDAKGKVIHRGLPERAMKVLTVEEYMSERAERLHAFPPRRRTFLQWLAQGLGHAMKSMGFSFHKVREKDIERMLERSYRKLRSRGFIAKRFDALERRFPTLRNPFVRHTLQSQNIQRGMSPDTPKPPSLKGKLLKAFLWVSAPYIMILVKVFSKGTSGKLSDRYQGHPDRGTLSDKRPICREILNDLQSQRQEKTVTREKETNERTPYVTQHHKQSNARNKTTDDLTMTI